MLNFKVLENPKSDQGNVAADQGYFSCQNWIS